MNKITQKLIDETLEKQDTSLMPTFAIIKDREKNLIDRSVHTVYLAVTKPDRQHCIKIERNDALQLIDLFQMVPYNECKSGAVYDTKDQQYKRKYHGQPVKI